MTNNKQYIVDDEYIIATLIKLVAGENPKAICQIANNLKQNFKTTNKIDSIDNSIIYDSYHRLLEEI